MRLVESLATKKKKKKALGGGEMNWEIGMDIHTLLMLRVKQTVNERLLYR